MKKVLLMIAFALMAGVGMTACGEDDVQELKLTAPEQPSQGGAGGSPYGEKVGAPECTFC